MRQRVMIAIGLACNPKLIIADEPTTALDVTIQAQILELMKDLSRRLGIALVVITHNLGVVARYADRVNVMYAARIVEQGAADNVFLEPAHPYTIGLLRSVPRLDLPRGVKLETIEGLPPNLADRRRAAASRRAAPTASRPATQRPAARCESTPGSCRACHRARRRSSAGNAGGAGRRAAAARRRPMARARGAAARRSTDLTKHFTGAGAGSCHQETAPCSAVDDV